MFYPWQIRSMISQSHTENVAVPWEWTSSFTCSTESPSFPSLASSHIDGASSFWVRTIWPAFLIPFSLSKKPPPHAWAYAHWVGPPTLGTAEPRKQTQAWLIRRYQGPGYRQCGPGKRKNSAQVQFLGLSGILPRGGQSRDTLRDEAWG